MKRKKDPNRLVAYYDHETRQVQQVPRRELGPGHMQARMEIGGRIQEVWIKTPKQSPRRHDSLPPECEEILPSIQAIFAGTYDRTLDEWRDGFLRDTHPEREVFLWRQMTLIFPDWTDGKPPEYRKEVLGILLAATSHPSQEDATATAQKSCKLVSTADAAAIVHAYYELGRQYPSAD